MRYCNPSAPIAAAVLLVALAGCSDAVAPTTSRVSTPPDPWDAFPPPPDSAAVYHRTTAHSVGSLARFLLFEDGTFTRQAVNHNGPAEYSGKYARADSVISFEFSSTWFELTAAATVRGDSLHVKYSCDEDCWFESSMEIEDGVYVLSAGEHPDGAPHIYLADASGANVVRLVRGSWPAWSPDGRRIAFHRDGDRIASYRNGEVWVVGADGSGETRLASGGFPSWSPDGTQIVFTSAEGISMIDLDGSGFRTLVRHDFHQELDPAAASDLGVAKPAWSPDGIRIVFEHLGDGDIEPPQAYVTTVHDSIPRLLTTPDAPRRYAESDPSWSPDGSKVVLWSFSFGIVAVDVDSGERVWTYGDVPRVVYGARPAWSPDGSSIAFTAQQVGYAGTNISTVPTAGGSARLLIRNAYQAAWSPDGSRIAFVRGRRD